MTIYTGLLAAVFNFGENPPGESWELITGMILLTIIPFMIDLLLEVSYQPRKQRKIYVDDENANIRKERAFMCKRQ